MKIFKIDFKAAETPVNASFFKDMINVSKKVKGVKMGLTAQNKGINL